MRRRPFLGAWGFVPLATIALAAITTFCLSPSSRGSAATDTMTLVEATSTPPPECLVPADLDVVIIIDRSGSMITNYSGDPPQTRLYWAKEAALALVNGIAGGPSSHSLGDSHVEVITFGNGTASVVQAFSDNADTVRAAINSISNPPPYYDTYIAPALQQATGDLNGHVHGGSLPPYKVVVLLSDGRNYANGDPVTGNVCDATHQRRQDTVDAIPALHAAADTVYTVSIGDETTCGPFYNQLCPANNCNPNELDVDLLEDIAKGPPGDYTNAEDASTLPNIYFDLSQELTDICVSFSGHKYNDLACDGTGGSNPPLGGVPIVLLQDSTIIDQTTSGADGAYSFINQQPGTYLICEDLATFPGRTQSYPTAGGGVVSHSPYGLCYERTLTTPRENAGGLDFYNCPPSTATPTPTNTPVPPSPTPTDTPVPPSPTPTDTPVPPSPTPTDTPVPPTSTPTDTPVPPTSTPTDTPVPPSPTPTDTPVPPSPTPTDTEVPPSPTPTDTEVPPSATPTDTPVPSATPTSTPTSILTPTRTHTPEATDTPRHRENTDTPTPRPTATFTPLSQVSPAAVTPRATPTRVHEAQALPPAGSGDGSGGGGAAAAGLVAAVLAGITLLERMRLLRNRQR